RLLASRLGRRLAAGLLGRHEGGSQEAGHRSEVRRRPGQAGGATEGSARLHCPEGRCHHHRARGGDRLGRRAAGIPVFLADRDVDVADKTLFVTRISADFNLEGKLAGAWLAQASKGNCQIVELQGTTGSAPAIERKKGFEAVNGNFPGMKIVKTESGNFTTDGGKQVMESFVKATDGLKGICAVFAHNDNMQLGAIQAMKEAGLKPGKDVLMVSVDYVPAMKKALEAGEANASVELRSAIGKYIYPVVLEYLKGKKEWPKWVMTPSDMHRAASPAE